MGIDNYRELYNDDILNALDQLKPQYRRALLYQQAGYRLKEIAEIEYRNGALESRNIETIKSRLFLARQTLQQLLTRDGKEDRLAKQIKTVFTAIAKRLIDPSFTFPEGGKVNRQLHQFIADFSKICGGEFNAPRLVDYCVFQLHKNRNAQYQRALAPKVFGATALQKYQSMSSRAKIMLKTNGYPKLN